MYKKVLITLFILCFLPAAIALSENLDLNQKYLFYMHGRWVEMHGLNKPHSQHGYYQYDKIVNYFSKKGFIVISEARSDNIKEGEYARKVEDEIREFLSKGVKPGDITVIGHSKGGLIALILSSFLKEPEVNFVLMAGCGKEGTRFRGKFERFLSSRASKACGRILSIYDVSDLVAGSCQEVFDRAENVVGKEIVLDTGKGHGIFYYPDPIWTEEVIKWSE